MDESRRLQFISYGLYRKVNEIVGLECEIQIRRTVTNLRNAFEALDSALTDLPYCRHLSGSLAEGLRFTSSDMDWMSIYRHIIVTNNQDNYENHNDNITVLVMENHRCRPGFSLLRVKRIPSSLDEVVTLVIHSCVQVPHGQYISSSLWKDKTPKFIPNGVLHGPCVSGWIGERELDLAYCLRCDTWPESAVGCINRLRSVGWPSDDVLNNILSNGCHMVAIGAKGSYFENEEWRISFSFAEKTLIHNMNHCQFLCYGLLKIFLKEAIENRETEGKLLCSYFLKTAVFWEICNEPTQWSSATLLYCFWACFRRLIGWVYNGYCPNFFITENNMFYGKIQGRVQLELLGHLTVLYSEGYNCLLRCPSLQPSIGVFVTLPFVTRFLPSENIMYSNSHYAITMIVEIMNGQPQFSSLSGLQMELKLLSFLIVTDENDVVRSLTLDVWKRYAKQYFIAYSADRETSTYNLHNKEMHNYIHSILCKSKNQSFDLLHHKILPSVYSYRCRFYRIAIKLLLRAKSKLQQPNAMYGWNLNEDNYRAAGGEHKPLTTMMKKVVVYQLRIPMDMCVPELTMEHQASTYLLNVVSFPPLTIVDFLLYLSYYHLGQFADADAVAEEISVLLASDNEKHIYPVHRAISWTMLGICQEMSGELTNAYYSYTEALHDQYNFFRDSTRVRIQNILMKINSEYQ